MKPWRKLNKGCVLLVTIPFLIVIGLLLFAEWVWGGSIKPSLDPQYIPTAEYLIQHPQPTPSFLQIQHIPGTILGSRLGGLRVEVICKRISLVLANGRKYFSTVKGFHD